MRVLETNRSGKPHSGLSWIAIDSFHWNEGLRRHRTRWMTYPEELGSIPRYATARSQTDMRLPLRRFRISEVKGSTPWATGCNKGVNWVGKQSKQADCKSIGLRLRGFESLPAHKNGIAGFLFGKTRLAHVGYITSSILCGVSSTVECQPSKLNMRVRFPYSALTFKFEKYSNWF